MNIPVGQDVKVETGRQAQIPAQLRSLSAEIGDLEKNIEMLIVRLSDGGVASPIPRPDIEIEPENNLVGIALITREFCLKLNIMNATIIRILDNLEI